ncbi:MULTISPECIES: acyl-CoA dehydrogenase family protein [Nocardia]|uniref:Acyl-CoA dehydrogenase n=1 Tax=Nocardia nova TaxID=37330 RepID=A0A2T2ZCZ3_9NOCA|nr:MULTISPECIES: acyl-CoA dehydrogenase family protein [Nocardia]PSR65632.1 acyl-CoA dehydrogenase [Nocardia nova]
MAGTPTARQRSGNTSDRAEDTTEFREQLRAWLESVPRPAGLRDYGPTPTVDDVLPGRQWQRLLADAGYACLPWPVEYGGRGSSIMEQAVFAEETARAGVPRQLGLVGPALAAPVIMEFGTDEQRARHLEPIRVGEHLWCQLFSEPEAGSDLASLRTRAVAEGDEWVIDGHKVWTSAAAAADYGLLIARTGPGRYDGLTAFIVPMTAPGITVRPLEQMDGESKFNEVFLTGVRLRTQDRLGEIGQGWAVATATLGTERLSLGTQSVSMFAALDDIVVAAARRDRLTPRLREDIVSIWTRIWLLRATWLRAVHAKSSLTSPTFSVLKVMSSETHRDLADLAVDALGLDITDDPADNPIVHRMLVARAQTILGGTSEIQRNILAERVLGLPREPAVKKG